jgi:dolichol-phosphate mannosyltransferase
MPRSTLIFVPTYNERDNVEHMVTDLIGLGIDADVLFIDDASPDGTGDILDALAGKHRQLSVIHRTGKLGIGSAHLDAIRWAYAHGYERLVSLDCDFTHSPRDVLRVLEHLEGHDLAAGSRYLEENSLPGWNILRRSLTGFGHALTKNLLGIRVDATGALRGYDLLRIPREVFDLVTARGYAFFFESMFLLVRNGFTVGEFAIVLPARTYGSSKMTLRETWRSGSQLLSLWMSSTVNPARFKLVKPFRDIDPALVDPQGWDSYWEAKERPGKVAYEVIATAYRVSFIRSQLERFIRRNFPDGSRLLHAGCGGGQVDIALQREMSITAIDISPGALRLYQRNNPNAAEIRHANILDLPFPPETFDGVYNLGVLEHFTRDEIAAILAQFHTVLKRDGKLVLFWPHKRATSVAVLKAAHWFLNGVLAKPISFHPAEISLLESKRWAEQLLEGAGFSLVQYSFGPRDLFVQAVIVAQKRPVT